MMQRTNCQRRSRLTMTLLAAAALPLAATPNACAVDDVAGSLIEFNDNGGWSWFEDERSVVDAAAGKIIVSSVANPSGPGGASRGGDVDVVSYDLDSGALTRFVLNAPRSSNSGWADDHNSAALWIRPDGRYLAAYARHGSDSLSRRRISSDPGSVSHWSSELGFNNNAGTTYSNLHYLPADNGGTGRLYNFIRSVNFNPNILISDDLGQSWSYGGRLLTQGTGSQRPYLRYFSNSERIDFIATEQHPRNFDNSVYHGYVQDGKLYNSNGMIIDGNLFDSSAAAPDDLTAVFTTGTSFGGVSMRRAWTIDVASDDAGRPYAIFQARANDSDLDHRFFYARFNGAAWSVHELAKAGGYLYASENDYTGLAALDPNDPNRLFISSKIDPRTDVTMPHYEIFEGITDDGGASWEWAPITFNSTVDNLRPIVPQWDVDDTALLWMRGSYFTYTSYDTRIVGLTEFTPLVSHQAGDLNRDGNVDAADFTLLMAGLHTNFAGLTAEEAYARGDLNGDRLADFDDFAVFRSAFDLANGAGALAALMHTPEPSSLSIAFTWAGLWLIRSSRATVFGARPCDDCSSLHD